MFGGLNELGFVFESHRALVKVQSFDVDNVSCMRTLNVFLKVKVGAKSCLLGPKALQILFLYTILLNEVEIVKSLTIFHYTFFILITKFYLYLQYTLINSTV